MSKNRRDKFAKSEENSSTRDCIGIPIDLNDMPCMEKLLDGKKASPVGNHHNPNSKRKNSVSKKNKSKAYSSELEFSSMPTMQELVDSKTSGPPIPQKKIKEKLKSISDIEFQKDALNVAAPHWTECGRCASFEELFENKINVMTSIGQITHKHNDSFMVSLENDKEGVIRHGRSKNTELLKCGDTVLVQWEEIKSSTSLIEVTHLKTFTRLKSPISKIKKRVNNVNISSKQFVIDGSNVCRSYMDLEEKSTIIPLVTLIANLLKRNAKCYCVFDANERYVLRGNSKEPFGEKVYDYLIMQNSDLFLEVPGGSDADEYVLSRAHKENFSIISNDNFSKPEDGFLNIYPWLITDKKRLIKGTVEDGMLIVENLEIFETLPVSPQKPFNEMQKYLIKSGYKSS